MTKKKLILKIIAGLVSVALIVLILFITNSFTGNPISAAIANKNINRYLEDNYSFVNDLDYKEQKTFYNFKFGNYGKYVQSKSSQDTAFYVTYNRNGGINDTYDDYVVGKFNTYTRLEKEFDSVVEKVFKKSFPYETDILIAGFSFDENDRDKLTLDMKLDLDNLPLESNLSVYIFSDKINYEVLRDRLIEVDELMKNNSLQFKNYSVVIRQPRSDMKDSPRDESLHLFDFPVEKVESEDLITVIKDHQAQWEIEHEK
ncbi:hypothetical protein KQI88_00785 [Alkaliphilus sp. MSJ-5]|uniref:Uncharacterized protein n=1 Tax=Alkaliphilus flagellatus TaxID=2841507 RepID=A0ABS6FXJ1_9FIRM|nr:hypothetical protein [Alkaliphilus flagellatus]MBU5674950.1 hypothetical protein [Alkaliphilus flagellatus]